MTELILPQHFKRQHRPYATASTIALLEELQERQELIELSLQQALPDHDKTVDPDAMSQQILASMFQQAGIAIASSGFAFTAVGKQVDPLTKTGTVDILVAKILIARHPAIPQPAPVPHANNP